MTILSARLTSRLCGRTPLPADYVFLGPRGLPVCRSDRRALYRFHELLAEAGTPATDGVGQKLDFHALRHSFATALGRAGVGLAQAQALLGHADPRLTAAVYMHLGVEDLRGAVAKVAGAG